MFQYVALTDGTTTVELTDTINYALVSYAPVVAPLRDSDLGGQGPYEDVVDTITFHAMGCTAAEAYAAAAVVNDLLDQARRWWLGDNVAVVILVIQAQDSALSPLQVVVQGRVPGSAPNLALQAAWNETWGKYVIQNITIQSQRRGQFLSPTTESASSASATYPTIHTATFSTSVTRFPPIDLSISGFTAADVFNLQVGYCLIAPASRLLLIEAEGTTASSSGTGTVTATTVADAAKLASAGSVRRWTGTTAFTGTVQNLSTLLGGFSTSAPVGVFAAVRLNSSTITGSWTAEGWSNAAIVSQTAALPVVYASNQPQIISLGTLKSRGGIDQVSISFTGVFPITTTLDIDYVVLIRLDDAASRVVGLADNVTNRLSAIPGGTAEVLEMRANALTDVTPADRYYDAANNITEYAGYTGDLFLVMAGTTVGFTLLSTGSGPSGVGNAWRPATTAAGAAISSVVTVTRRLAYLIAE